MLGRDFEDEVRSRSVFELACNPIGYFGKMNSTLGSVVPLAMFFLKVGSYFDFDMPSIFYSCWTQSLKIYRHSESFCLVQMVSSEIWFVQLSDYVVFEAFGQLNPDPSCNKSS